MAKKQTRRCPYCGTLDEHTCPSPAEILEAAEAIRKEKNQKLLDIQEGANRRVEITRYQVYRVGGMTLHRSV
jgi:hypothetical protein